MERETRIVKVSFLWARRDLNSALPSPFGDISVTQKETREGLVSVGAKRLELGLTIPFRGHQCDAKGDP